jgi:hypothetical protein
MGRGSAKQKVVSGMGALGPKSSMLLPEVSPGDNSGRRGSTRGQNSGARAVGPELPKGASGTSRKRGLDASLAEVPLGPVDSAIGDGDPMDLVESSSGVEAALAAIDEQEAPSISIPVAAHNTNPCTLPLQADGGKGAHADGEEHTCKQRPSQPTRSHIIPHHRTSSRCNAVQRNTSPHPSLHPHHM